MVSPPLATPPVRYPLPAGFRATASRAAGRRASVRGRRVPLGMVLSALAVVAGAGVPVAALALPPLRAPSAAQTWEEVAGPGTPTVTVTDRLPNWEVRADVDLPSDPPPHAGADPVDDVGAVDVGAVDVGAVDVGAVGGRHAYRLWITKVSATDVDVHTYRDGAWQSVRHLPDAVGVPLRVTIVDRPAAGTVPARLHSVTVGRTRIS